MTNEEAIAIIRNEYKCVDRDCDIEKSCGKCDLMMPSKEPILEAYKMAIQALSQQPKTQMVDKSNFDIEQYKMDLQGAYDCGFEAGKKAEQEPCDDAISREAVYSILNEHHIDEDRIKSDMDERQNLTVNSIASDVSLLPSVTQKSETGYWINLEKKYKGQVLPFWGRYGCSKCGGYGEGTFNYCPNCGAKMHESEEV